MLADRIALGLNRWILDSSVLLPAPPDAAVSEFDAAITIVIAVEMLVR
ncbi:MAG: hypothetical protein QOI39_73 [Mycobacterium sp.]|nr:hypothetical protein [Mycobacterium sp.]